MPLHDSDLPENRWKDSEWKHFVLWEKLELQIRKRKRWIVALVLLAGLAILSIPTVEDRYPKWLGVSLVRRFAIEVHRLELESARIRKPVLIQLLKEEDSLWVLAEAVSSCTDYSSRIEVRRVRISTPLEGKRYEVLTESLGLSLELPYLSQQFCYDPERGQVLRAANAPLTALGLIPVKDLADKRLDRVTLLEVRGPAATLNFD